MTDKLNNTPGNLAGNEEQQAEPANAHSGAEQEDEHDTETQGDSPPPGASVNPSSKTKQSAHCSCCGMEGKKVSGCSSTGPKSHVCLRTKRNPPELCVFDLEKMKAISQEEMKLNDFLEKAATRLLCPQADELMLPRYIPGGIFFRNAIGTSADKPTVGSWMDAIENKAMESKIQMSNLCAVDKCDMVICVNGARRAHGAHMEVSGLAPGFLVVFPTCGPHNVQGAQKGWWRCKPAAVGLIVLDCREPEAAGGGGFESSFQGSPLTAAAVKGTPQVSRTPSTSRSPDTCKCCGQEGKRILSCGKQGHPCRREEIGETCLRDVASASM